MVRTLMAFLNPSATQQSLHRDNRNLNINSVLQELTQCKISAFKAIHGCTCSNELGATGFPNAIVIAGWEGTHSGPKEVTPSLHSTPAVKRLRKRLPHSMPKIEGLGTQRHPIPGN